MRSDCTVGVVKSLMIKNNAEDKIVKTKKELQVYLSSELVVNLQNITSPT